MTIIKCNMCGGGIELTTDKTFGTCEFCGSTVTLPRIDDEQRAAAFNRGNHFRRIGEFDKALAVYEHIIREDDTDAEAHWCAALCRFGIEYVEDPATYEWIPTCHRASFDSFLEDVDLKAAVEHSDGLTRRLYQKEAAKIAEIQRGILATSQNTEPYDVFICYKESDEAGQRTRDSLMAQDIYYQLTDQGHRVFFSRITLEDIPGAQYEPYIFAALNSAKVMVAVGTKPEHFSAVWVKNEWSRFLALMRRDHSRVLLPCYRDMDPCNLPEQLAVLQSYDMGKIGFIQDLIRGVDKVVKAEQKPAVPAETVVIQQSAASNTNALVKRGYMALEDRDWKKAEEYFDQALNQNSECAEAYLGMFLASAKHPDLTSLVSSKKHQAISKKTIRAEACPKATQVENDAVAQYSIRGYFEDAKIRELFLADHCYDSQSAYLQQQLRNTSNWLNRDKNLIRALDFSSQELHSQIEQTKHTIINAFMESIRTAEQVDEKKKSAAALAYRQHIELALESVRSKYAQLDAKLGVQYQNLCAITQDGKINPKDYLTLIEKFKNLGGYNDSEKRGKELEAQLKDYYENLCSRFEQAHSAGEFDDLSIQFREIGDYAKCYQLANACDERAKRKRVSGCLIISFVLILVLLTYVLNNFDRIIRSILFGLF